MAPRHGKFNGGGSRLSGFQVVGPDLLVLSTPPKDARSRFRSPQRHEPVNRACSQVRVDISQALLSSGSSNIILDFHAASSRGRSSVLQALLLTGFCSTATVACLRSGILNTSSCTTLRSICLLKRLCHCCAGLIRAWMKEKVSSIWYLKSQRSLTCKIPYHYSYSGNFELH